MRYLFFDIECANCFDGKGKICSFGYVITDTDFQVLQKEDWIINPRARFYLAARKSGEDIELAYPQSRFRKAPPFPAFYEAIRDLLCAPDQIVMGHAVSNDVKFICDECERYALPTFSYDFHDSQKIFCQYKQVKNQVALDKILLEFGIEPTTLHKSDDDALMTMWATRALCQAHGLELPALLEKYPTCGGTTVNGNLFLKDAKHYNNDVDNQLRNGNLRMFLGYLRAVKPKGEILSSVLTGQKVLFARSYESNHFRQMVYLVQALANHGAQYCHNPRMATVRIFPDGKLPTEEQEGKLLLSFSQLLEILNIDRDFLAAGEIDVDTMFLEVGAVRVPLRRKSKRSQKRKGKAPDAGEASPSLASVGSESV